MKEFYKNHFSWIFFIIAIIELSAVLWSPEIRYLSKPSIVISLLVYYFFSSACRDKWFMLALIFAFAGDSFLMFEGYFLLGLASFLVMQLLYAILFAQQRGPQSILKIMLSVLVISLSAISTYYILPSAGDMSIPVVVYSFIILCMVLSGIWRKENGSHYYWILIGVMSFLISDGILAVNKFSHSFASAGFLVMLTYILAQYLIVRGYLKYEIEKAN